MKMKYENPDMEVINLGMDDGATVVTASSGLEDVTEGATGDSVDWGNLF